MQVRLLTEGIIEQLNVSYVNSAVYNILITVLTLEKASKKHFSENPAALLSLLSQSSNPPM